MKKWCSMPAMKIFIKQDELAAEIQDCHTAINDCMTRLQVCQIPCGEAVISYIVKITAALETQGWQMALRTSLERDQSEILEYLSDLSNTQEITLGIVQQTSADVQALMKLMQKVRYSSEFPVVIR